MEQLKLLSAEFYHFKGFSNSNIKHLKVSFEEVLQILNSTNGTGKTTFMLELNPKTIDKELFEKDGYKRLVYQHTSKQGEVHTYELYSSHKQNHFIDTATGVNLNDGQTITQYNTLLKELLGVTPYTWDIAMGTTPFTSLDKNERRKWIETISGVDFGYAFDVYDKIVKRITGVKHSLKLLTNDLVAAEERVIDSNELKALEVSKGTLVTLNNDLMRLSDSNVDIKYRGVIERKLDELKAKALAQSKQLEQGWYRTDAPEGVTSIDALEALQLNHEKQVDRLDQEIDNLVNVLADKEELLSRVHEVDGLSLTEVEQRYSAEVIALEKLNYVVSGDGYSEYLELFKDKESLHFAKSIQPQLTEFSQWCFIQEQFDDDACQFPFSGEQRGVYQSTLQKALQQIAIYKTRQEELTEHVQSIKAGKEITCPNCQHLFVDGLSKLESLRLKWKELNEKCLEQKALVKDMEGYLLRYDQTTHNINHIKQWFITAFDSGKPAYLRYLLDKVEAGESLRCLVGHIAKVGQLLPLLIRYHTHKETVEELTHLKAKFAAVNAVTDTKVLEGEVEALRRKLISKRVELGNMETALDSLSKYHRDIDRQMRLAIDHIATLKELHSYKEKYIRVINECIAGSMLKDVQERLAVTSSRLNANDSTITLIDNLKSLITRQEDELMLLGDLHKAMSPNGGVIAEQLTGYCTTFSNKLTEVLELVWGYEMKILPCVNKNGIIDYKFPIKLEKNTVGDIAKGSKAMRSIINLAVMICTRAALGLTHLPMFLDEVGDGLDVTHNEKLRGLIRKLLRSNQCSMVFFVDHDVNNRSVLGNYDEIVFNADQVITGGDYNQFVEITYY